MQPKESNFKNQGPQNYPSAIRQPAKAEVDRVAIKSTQTFGVKMEKDEFILSNKCVVCGYIKRNKTTPADDLSVILPKK